MGSTPIKSIDILLLICLSLLNLTKVLVQQIPGWQWHRLIPYGLFGQQRDMIGSNPICCVG